MRDSQFHFLHKIWNESRQECSDQIDKLRTLAKHWLQFWGFKIIQIHASKKHCLDHQDTRQLPQLERAAHVLSVEAAPGLIFEVPRLRISHKTNGTYQVSWWRTGQGRTDNAHILYSQNDPPQVSVKKNINSSNAMALLVNLISKHENDHNIFARFTSTKDSFEAIEATKHQSFTTHGKHTQKNKTCCAQEWKFQPSMPARRLHWQNWHGTITQSGFNAYWSQSERAKSVATCVELQCEIWIRNHMHKKKSTWQQVYCNDGHFSLQTWFAFSWSWFWTKKVRLQRHDWPNITVNWYSVCKKTCEFSDLFYFSLPGRLFNGTIL